MILKKLDNNKFNTISLNCIDFASAKNVLINQILYSESEIDLKDESSQLTIKLINYETQNKISINFEHIESMRITNESYLFQGGYDLNQINVNQGILFKSNSSTYLEWLNTVSDNVYMENLINCCHFVVLSQEGVIEVISEKDPIFTRLI